MSLHTTISQYYDQLIRKHGITSSGAVGWSSGKQEIRFLDLLKNLDLQNKYSILDLGCGRGDLFEYLKNFSTSKDYSYLGCDVNLTFIDYACERYSMDNRSQFLFIENDFPTNIEQKSFDYCVASGLLSSSFVTREYRDSILQNLFLTASKAISFNLLTKDVDFEESKYFYSEISEVIRMFEPISSKIIVERNPNLYEKTITIYK